MQPSAVMLPFLSPSEMVRMVVETEHYYLLMWMLTMMTMMHDMEMMVFLLLVIAVKDEIAPEKYVDNWEE